MIDIILNLFQLKILIPWMLGMLFGLFVGCVPGLTATMAVALIIPLTYYMNSSAAFALILGISFTAIFAGDIPATFLRIPGTPASGAAVLDGFEMYKKGKGNLALALDLVNSTLGGLLGITCLIFISPILANFALKFTFFEYFWLGVFGLSMTAIISKGNIIKGFIAVLIGLAVSTIGIDVTTGYPRFSFGNINLTSGISFIPAMIGLFGFSEVLNQMTKKQDFSLPTIEKITKIPIIEALKITFKNVFTFIKSSIVGVLIGALPGAGADIAAWVSYGVAKKTSKNGDKFGTGYEEGVLAPTAANNAALGGTWIPAFIFGVPGDTITAIVLGAMLMYGLKPGPRIFIENGVQMRTIFLIAIISHFFLFIFGYLAIKASNYLLKLPRNIVLVAIVIFCIVGSYSINNNFFDVYVMIFFGLIGFFFDKIGIPLAPIILGIILGPMVENNLRVGLIQSDGSLLPFVVRPICLILILMMIFILFGGNILNIINKLIKGKK